MMRIYYCYKYKNKYFIVFKMILQGRKNEVDEIYMKIVYKVFDMNYVCCRLK